MNHEGTKGTEMKITAIAPWFGGKRNLAPRIVEELGEHRQYFEPFCGSLAVLFAKWPVCHETVNDLHGDLINLAFVLRDPGAAVELYDRLQSCLLCDELLRYCQLLIADPFEPSPEITEAAIDRAAAYFYCSWVSRNGVSGTAREKYSIAVRWTPGGGSPTTRFRSATESIPAWHERLKNVSILHRDAFSVLESISDVLGTAIYCDPPYMLATRSSKDKSSAGAGRYKHEFAVDDHARLATQLNRFRNARIVLSYYDCPEVRDMYPGWRVIELSAVKTLSRQNKRGTDYTVAPEILLVNQQSDCPNSGPGL